MDSTPTNDIEPTARERLLRARRRRSKRGVALLMVLGTLAVLTVMLTEFQDATSAELGSSVAARDSVKAEYAARSAFNLSRLLLAAEPTVRAAVAPLFAMTGQKPPQIPVWEFSDVILGPFGDEANAGSFEAMSGLSLEDGRNLGMEGAGFRVNVVDEDSKINFNLAARADSFSQQRMAEQFLAMTQGVQYEEMFQERDEKGERHDRRTICGAVIDWTDPNTDRNPCEPRSETATTAGAEDSYYQLLERPYRRKNAAFDSLQELRLVRGIDDEFWRTFIQPDPDDPKSRAVTVWGTGAININTANPRALLSVVCQKAVPGTPLCEDPEVQLRFLSTLRIVQGMSGGVPVFSSPSGFIGAVQGKGPIGKMLTTMGFQPVELLSTSEVEKTLAVKSKVFSVYATGYVHAGKRETRSRLHAVVDMRGAPPPGTQEQVAQQNRMRDAGLLAAQPNAAEDEDSEAENPYLMASPGGSIIYYRVD